MPIQRNEGRFPTLHCRNVFNISNEMRPVHLIEQIRLIKLWEYVMIGRPVRQTLRNSRFYQCQWTHHWCCGVQIIILQDRSTAIQRPLSKPNHIWQPQIEVHLFANFEWMNPSEEKCAEKAKVPVTKSRREPFDKL